MKILVTGFKPFLGEQMNPSEILANELARKFSEVQALILPVEFKKSFDILKIVQDMILTSKEKWLVNRLKKSGYNDRFNNYNHQF